MSERTVEELARLAGLDVDRERAAALAPQLDGLLTGADAVNRFMLEHPDVGPIVSFVHPELRGDPP